MNSMKAIHTLPDLWDALKAHDWHHAMSDDVDVHRWGRENWNRLVTDARGIEGGDTLLKDYSNHVFKGGPKPERPTEMVNPNAGRRGVCVCCGLSKIIKPAMHVCWDCFDGE